MLVSIKNIVLALCTAFLYNSCSSKLTSIKLHHDTEAPLPFVNTIDIGASLFYSDGKIKTTKGLLSGTKNWHNITLRVIGGTAHNGTITIDYAAAAANNNKITIQCSNRHISSGAESYEIKIPKPVSIKSHPSRPNSTPGFPITMVYEFALDNRKQKTVSTDEPYNFLQMIQLSYLGYKHSANLPLFLPCTAHKYDDKIELKHYYDNDTTSLGSSMIPITYKGKYELNFSGANGNRGLNGNNAVNSGGRDGLHGQYGGNGQNGSSGAPINIYLSKLIDSSANLVLVVVENGNLREPFILDSKSDAQVKINTNGGNGGNGGHGGYGGNGADQTAQTPLGNGGNGGNGGHGGNGGDGGTVNIICDEDLVDLKSILLSISNKGGMGGYGGDGGKGGSDGSKLKPTTGRSILSILGTYKGANGLNGQKGYSGQDGRIQVSKFTSNEMKNKIDNLNLK